MLTIEQRLDQLERRNRRLTATLALMVVAICAVVTMAATGKKNGDFDVVTAKRILVKHDNGENAVTISSFFGYGMVKTYGPNGKELVVLGSTTDDHGMVKTYGSNGKELVRLTASTDGKGMVETYGSNGKELVTLGSTDNGGAIEVYNKTGEGIVSMRADEYGNGEVGAWNRKGKGRTLHPGP